MNSSEQLISDHLSGLGLRPERFPKPETRVPGQKSPDFKVFRGSILEFYCEVKELTDEALAKPTRSPTRGVIAQRSEGI